MGIKCVGDIVEGSANVSLDTLGFEPSLPDFPLPEEGVHIRWPDKPVALRRVRSALWRTP